MSDSQTGLLPRQLIIMRHAKSSWSDPGMADFDRPLNKRGQSAAPLMGQRLHDASIDVDLILASTAQRVRETLKLLQTQWTPKGQIVWEKRIYLANVPTLMELLFSLDSDWSRVMIIGHNPGLSELVMTLTGKPMDMSTAAIAILDGPSTDWPSALRQTPWQERVYWTPKDED